MSRAVLPIMLIAVMAVVLIACSVHVEWPWVSPLPSSDPGLEVERREPPELRCLQATPELLQVEPVISPTGERAQVITVHMGNMEAVTVTAESGVFAAVGSGGRVEIALLPDTEHHLEVAARVREIETSDGCVYGGYTLRARRDKHGAPLVIQQGQVVLLEPSGSVIAPENVVDLQPLFALTPDARLTTDFRFLGQDRLVSVGYATRISVWSLVTGTEVQRIGEGREEAAALTLAIHPGGTQFATAGTANDRVVRLWDLSTWRLLNLGQHDALVSGLAFSPGGTRLASGDNGNQICVWDVATGQPLISLAGDVPLRSQAFNSLFWLDEEVIVAGGSDAIYWWDVATGQMLVRLPRLETAAFFVDVALAGQGQALAAAAQDAAVYVWNAEAEKWAVWPTEPGLTVSAVEFSPDGRLLAAATHEGKMLFWSVDTGKLLANYGVTTSSIAAIRFSPDGQMVAVGGWDGPIWLWGIP